MEVHMDDYKYLTEERRFITIDEDSEYDRRLLYEFSETIGNDHYEGTLFIPLCDEQVMDWTFKHFKNVGDMFVLSSRKYMLKDTPEWFQNIALPFDHARRLQKLTITN
jgi:hypothetical protein